MIRFHLLPPWIAISIAIALIDLLLPSWIAICSLQVVLQLAAFRSLAAKRMVPLTVTLMLCTIAPGLIRAFLQLDATEPSGKIIPVHWFAPVRTWVVMTLAVALLYHADQLRNRKRRLRLRRQLQRKVRRRSLQISRINEALRREVARRQATQQRLTRTESHLQSLAERMQLQVLRKDTEGVITYANEAFCRGVGRSADEVIGSTDSDLYPPATAEKYRNDDAQVMASGVPVDHVESHPTAEGKTGWVQVFKAPDYDEDDHCIGIQMVFWDVTDTYRRTAELRRSEARKRALFDAAREAVLLVDNEGRIVEANPSAESLLGGSSASLAGCLLDSVATPEPANSPVMEDAREHESDHGGGTPSRAWTQRAELHWQDLPTSERRELSVRRHDGTQFPAEISVHPIPLENSQGLAVFVRDITLRHRAIRALRDAKLAAEAANRTKSQFMAGVSHEIRTPLGGITGSATLLAGMDLPERAKQYVSMIRQSADLLSEVIGDILDFASIEAGRLQVDPAEMDLHQCVGEAFRCLATRAAGKDIEMVLLIDPDVPRKMIGDAKRIRQIVINLAGNAIKFTPRGFVQLHLMYRTHSADRVSDNTDDASLIIEVSDSGVGIAPELQRKIFEPFEQGDSGTTRRFGGTGLGLSISDQLVRQMGGRIDVHSRPGHGSTFRCFLPLPVVDKPAARHPEPVVSGRHVTLELQHPLQRAAIRSILESRGYVIAPQATLRIVDQGGVNAKEKSLAPSAVPDARVIWLVRVDDSTPPSARSNQPVLFKPILADELVQAIEQEPQADTESRPGLPAVGLPAVIEPQDAKARLLVVDDSEVNRTVIRDFLTLAGYHAEVVPSGAAAIIASGTTRYDCILMDLQMPELDGIETMQQIVRHAKHIGLPPPPVIALTAHATSEHRQRCLEAGMKSFLVKPIEPRQLYEAVDACITQPHSSAPHPAPAKLATDSEWQAKLLASAGGSRSTMLALVEAFLIEVPELCELLERSVATENLKEARRAAHTLKSCLKYVAPPEDWRVVLEVENAIQANSLETAKIHVPDAIRLGREWCDRVRSAIEPLSTTATP